MKNKAITSRDLDFAKWYTDIVKAARLTDYSSVKGCVVLEPNGYAIWEKMQEVLDKKFKELGHTNVYLPLLIPENLMKKESELIEGFAPEVAWVTQGGVKQLEERLCIRPTSETLFSDYYSRVVNSYRDLPMLYNQWCNVFRWEKETRPFLRSREFLWQEGHTIHETKEEAEHETRQMLEVYKWFHHEYLAIPSIVGKKTEKEKFSGADYTLTNEALMYNGIALQCGTSHYFGQRFSNAYDIKFLNQNGEYENVYQTSWGTTTRMIGGLIMVHSDDNGLVLPPKIAPKQVVIIPIGNDEKVLNITSLLNKKILENGITSYIDNSDKSPGFRFAEAEVNGIPIRIELGSRDIENNTITLVRRDTREKTVISQDEDIILKIKEMMEQMQNDLFNKALQRRDEMTYTVTKLEELEEIINNRPGFIKSMWCGNQECEEKIKEIKGTKSRCIPFDEEQESISDSCIVCGSPSKEMIIWGIQY